MDTEIEEDDAEDGCKVGKVLGVIRGKKMEE
jgi:hypothetical protein